MYEQLPKVLFGLFALAANLSHAQCSREDVDYYLSKGFSNDQIVVLCTADSKNQKSDRLIDQKVTNKDSVFFANSEAEKILSMSVDAENIHLSDTDFHFTQQQCLEFGRPNPNGIRKKFCPVFNYSVSRSDIELIDIEKPYLFSKKKVMLIGGTIKIELKSEDEQKQLKKQLIEHYISKTDIIKLALTPNVSEQKLRTTFKKIRTN